MLKEDYVTKITPAVGGNPVEVKVSAGGPSEARSLIEQQYGPVRTWWHQPTEEKHLKNFKATIRPEFHGGKVLDVEVRATGTQEAKWIIEHEYGPIRDWLLVPLADTGLQARPQRIAHDLD